MKDSRDIMVGLLREARNWRWHALTALVTVFMVALMAGEGVLCAYGIGWYALTLAVSASSLWLCGRLYETWRKEGKITDLTGD